MGVVFEGKVKNNILALIVEATEVLNEIQWKPWHKQKEIDYDRTKYSYEIADCFIFLINLAQAANLTPQDILNMIEQKQQVNLSRLEFKDVR